MLSFQSVAEEIKPHPTKAQILLELDAANETLETALSALKTLQTDPVDYYYIRKEAPALVLFYTNADVREATIILAETGFRKIKGINPAPMDSAMK